MNRKRNAVAGMVTSALAVGLAVTGPASTAHAEPGGRWYIVNQANGKCIQGNGYNKNLTLGTCRKRDAFHWNNYGSAKYTNYSTGTAPFGMACLAGNGRNKPVSLKRCDGGAGTAGWGIASLNNGAKTPIANAANCGYLQAVSATALKCGKRPANRKTMTWIIKYSL
ncbi:hypothetical protein OG427_13640 [Streptomyces sp. NBC_00133]|uniref:hypothetical protein n=2 Tax=unclassified Streptomyces TaxID=2593676 RepID=UPI0032546BC4